MKWTLEHLKEESIILMTVSGKYSSEDTITANRILLEAGKKHNCIKFLVDSSLLILKINRSIIFDLPSKVFTEFNLDPSSRMAMVRPKDSETNDMMEFFILATGKFGWESSILPNRKKAIDWLCVI